MELNFEKIEKATSYRFFLTNIVPNHTFIQFLYLINKGRSFSKKQKALELIKSEECGSIEEIIELCKIEVPGNSLKRRLGIGTYKKFYLGVDIDSGESKAIGVFDVSERGKSNMAKRNIFLSDLVKKEIEKAMKLKKLGNKYLLDIYDQTYDWVHHNYVLITELIEKTLQEELDEKEGKLPEKQILDYLYQIVEGLGIMHKINITHSDLTLNNIGLKEGVIKLMDFGLASSVCEFNEEVINTGSIDTRAPELFEGKHATTESDMWSLGCIIYRLAVGDYPFTPKIKKPKEPGEERNDYEKKVYNLILSKDIAEDLKTLKISEQIKRIIKKCLELDMNKRYKNSLELAKDLKK